MFQNIYLLGGNTLFKNIAERVCKGIHTLSGNTIDFKVFLPAER